MSRQTDQPEQPNSVPPAELNPLLNPLLAQHMGRWAEAYFTAPPDKREEAVQDLLRQLRNETSTKVAEEEVPPSTPASEPLQPINSPTVSALPMIACRSCGHENPVDQKFCGMCGSTIQQAKSDQELPSPHEPKEAVPSPETESEFHSFHQRGNGQTHGYQESSIYDLKRTGPASIERVREIYTRNTESGDYPLFESTEPSFAYRYRVFIGLALAAIIGVLLYMSWHGGQPVSGLSQQAPQVPAASESSAQPSPESASTESSAPAKPTPPTQVATSPTNATQPQAEAKPETTVSKSDAQNSRPSAKPTEYAGREDSSAATQQLGTTGNGSDELAMAKRYLNNNGGPRNPSEAADWLWKSVAKQNSEATVMLADLYLRGDGISKNCDQARVLLDAAARKGRTDASERLRHMQAFGCR